MDYENLHSQHNQLEEQVNIIGQSVSSIAPSSVVTSSGNYTWNPSSSILNNGTNLYSSELIQNSRLLPQLATNFMATQDLSYAFDHPSRSFFFNNRQSTNNESTVANIKEETSDTFSKLRINFPYEVNKSNNNLLSTLYKQDNNHIIGLTNNSPPYQVSEPSYLNSQDTNSPSFGAGFTSFSQFLTNSISASSARSSSGSLSPSLVLTHEGFTNSQALDLLPSPRANSYRSTQSTRSSNNLGLFRECNMSKAPYGDMQEPRSSPSSISNKKSGLFNEATTRTKRRSPSSVCEPKDQSRKSGEAKKSKSTIRSSNPPLKVRKEKLGDRISALHRLVAPFGKTDTASVLTEAIGYIHFLHDQVQTLSMPYMKSSQSKPSRKTQQVHGYSKDNSETQVKLNLDLKSRGLCLVPVSCASYLNGFD